MSTLSEKDLDENASSTTVPVLKLALLTVHEIHAAYMPFVENGGLFYATKEAYPVGSSVTLRVKLMDVAAEYEVRGRVAWITPVGAQSGMKAGIGVQLSGEVGRDLVVQIENKLAGTSYLGQRSDTL